LSTVSELIVAQVEWCLEKFEHDVSAISVSQTDTGGRDEYSKTSTQFPLMNSAKQPCT